ncbi:conserved protein of unknown function [Acidithiobacillus ferrivorans]|uniref:Uncharacterized protein n=1 Tax=Acidithiobacillus ferrivorans TaxID=160808 RepID=A0A060URK3_9PROT|nr:hypothetical protein [Acidithiobacillus ferrivorans]CDQ09204.1 conserved exported hypothetical protein [Acidithiobacillus ferrivorans]SMH64872.1 conserved protein of unknown function [Acidithiobacillus ferrivorans]
MILAFIIIAMLVALVAIGNTEFQGTPKFAAQRKATTPASAPLAATPQRNAKRQANTGKSGGYRPKASTRNASPIPDDGGFVDLPEEAYAYHGLDLGGMPMYDNSVSDDRFLNDPDDGMSKDSTGFDEDI